MINRGIEWFEERAKTIWKDDPAKSILTILPSGYDTDEVAYKIAEFIKGNFFMRNEDENHTPVILPVIPDRNTSAAQMVNNIVKEAEKYLEVESQAHTEEYLSDKMETAFGELLNSAFYPVLLIKRFNSFTKLVDRELLSILSSLREFERENKVTSIVLSPMNYDVIRRKLRESPAQIFPFLNSPYGDNHEKIVAEPLQIHEFEKYARSQGISSSVANDLFAVCGGPDKIYEVATAKNLYGTGNLIDDCLEGCAQIFQDLLEHCEIIDNTELLIRLADEELSKNDIAHLVSKDLGAFVLKKNGVGSFRCSSEIFKRTIISILKNRKRPLFELSVNELLFIDENNEIEFKETFFQPSKKGEDGKDVPKDTIKIAAIKEIAGFLNSNNGTLLIGVMDAKNTASNKPEVKGIEFDSFTGDEDKYRRDINTHVKNALGSVAASFIDIRIETIDGKKVCRINCTKSPEPIYCNFSGKHGTSTRDVAYIRTGEDTAQPKTFKEWHDWLKEHFPSSL